MISFGILGQLLAGALGGAGAVAASFHFLKDRWMERVRAQYSRELETFKDTLLQDQKRMQARIDRSIFVSRAQFDTEFMAMKDIFALLTAVHLSIALIRPRVALSPENQTEDQKVELLSKRVSELVEAYNAFSTQLESISPFYPEALYRCLIECRENAAMEITDVQTSTRHEMFRRDWYVSGDANVKKFNSAYLDASKVIRDRLTRLSVVE
jgi:hypothetical protein